MRPSHSFVLPAKAGIQSHSHIYGGITANWYNLTQSLLASCCYVFMVCLGSPP